MWAGSTEGLPAAAAAEMALPSACWLRVVNFDASMRSPWL